MSDQEKLLTEQEILPVLENFHFGKVNITYAPLMGDSFSDPKSKEVMNQIELELPKNDLVIMEYFPPEVSQDTIFAAQSIRFSKVAALAAKYKKPVLAVDPAYDSQFLMDFRGIPLGIETTVGALGAYLIQRELEKTELEKLTKQGQKRRKLLFTMAGLLGTGLALPPLVAIKGEMDLKVRADTAFPTEGTLRRIIINRGIQKSANIFTPDSNKDVNALVVYPEWLYLPLLKYKNNPDLLEQDFNTLATIKQIPRFQHYFQARLFKPVPTGEGKTRWEKSVSEIN